MEGSTVHPLLIVTILTAIPVVSFALWAEYFAQSFEKGKDAASKAPTQAKKEEAFNEKNELLKLRFASAYVSFLLFLVMLTLRSITKVEPVSSFIIFLVGLGLTFKIRDSTQFRVAKERVVEREQRNFVARVFMWTVASTVGFLGVTMALIAVGLAAIQLLSAPNELKAILLLVVGLLSIGCTTVLFLALSPFHLRNAIPSEKSKDEKLATLVDSCFMRAKLPPPQVWILKSSELRIGQAMIAGLPRGKGPFTPGLFLGKIVAEGLTKPELEAVILHEVSHWALNHSKTLIKKSILWLVGTLTFTSFLLITSRLFLPAAVHSVVHLIGAVSATFIPFFFIRRETRGQELEADLYAVLNLGADPDAFATGLRKMDQWNQGEINPKEPQRSFLYGQTHPETEKRIERVIFAVEHARAALRRAVEAEFAGVAREAAANAGAIQTTGGKVVGGAVSDDAMADAVTKEKAATAKKRGSKKNAA